MAFLALLIFSALSVSAVAGWFSIVGLMAIFPAAAIAILSMGAVLEVAKLVTASWLYRNWNDAGILLRTYFTAAVIILSVITSMGIFGFLSKAHLENTIQQGGTNELQIQNLERQIENERRIIRDGDQLLSQLDETVNTLIEYDRIRGKSGAIAVREGQQEQRDDILSSIQSSIKRIDEISEELLPLQKERMELEVEVGPIKYIAELIYGESEKEVLEKAVRFVIILLVLVFDPLAILLVVSANMTYMQRKGELITAVDIDDTVVEEKIIPEEPADGVVGGLGDEPEVSPPSAVDDAANVRVTNAKDFGLDDTQLRKLDRSTRNKLEWLIDKGIQVKDD